MNRADLHICFLTSWYPTAEAPGNGSFFREQAEMLAAVGMQVGVIGLNSVPGTDFGWFQGPSVGNEDGLTTLRSTVPYFPQFLGGVEGFLLKRKSSELADLYQQVLGIPDVIHAHSAFPAFIVGQYLSEKWGRPLIVTEHRPSTVLEPRLGARGRAIRQAVEAAALRTTVSESFSVELEQFYHEGPWTALELPVFDHYFETPIHSGSPFTFLHVSHLDEGKRVAMLCEAFMEEFGDSEDVQLLIAGGYPEAVGSLRQQIDRAGERKNVLTLGNMSREQIPQLLAGADCFVLPSVVEAGGTVLSEAQAAGVPIVSTDTWAGLFAVRDGSGLLTPREDKQALMDAMRKATLADTFVSREEVRRRARDRYSAESFSSRWNELYRSCALTGGDQA